MKYLITYKNYKLLESVIVSSDDFKSIITKLPDEKISKYIYDIIEYSTDVNTKYNYLNLSDKNDEVEFLPDNQFQRFLNDGSYETRKRSNINVGRLVSQILKDNNIDFTETELVTFINNFKAYHDKMKNVDISIVKGNDILKWYLIDNYIDSNNGTLNNSCMADAKKNHFMKIYADNPNKISMVIIKEDNELVARALLWKIDESNYYLDRIYYTDGSQQRFIHSWVLENIVNNDKDKLLSHLEFDNTRGDISIQLDKINYDFYPYMDSFPFLYEKLEDGEQTGNGYVANYNLLDDGKNYDDYMISRIRSSSTGEREWLTHIYSKLLEKWFPKNEVVVVITKKDNKLDYFAVPKSMAFYSNLEDSYILQTDAVYSNILSDYLSEYKSISHPKYGVIPKDSIAKANTKYIGKYTNPLEIYNALKNGEELYEIDDVFDPNGNEVTFVYDTPNNVLELFKNDLLVEDYLGYKNIEKICVKLFKINGDLMETCFDNNYIFFKYGNSYIMEEDCILFNKNEIDSNYYKTVPINSSLIMDRLIHDFDINSVIEFINNSNISESEKQKLIESKNKYHNELLKKQVYKNRVKKWK